MMRPHNEARHRMSGSDANLKYEHRQMPLIGALGRWLAARFDMSDETLCLVSQWGASRKAAKPPRNGN
jgi:hypothetical protein